ncbi:MAG: helix-turn-helix domain-containing protein [Flavobacteriaceae bacterium]|nr:helix-turn-helix domain-containing protein [Flavobacteriaceae bacterium]
MNLILLIGIIQGFTFTTIVVIKNNKNSKSILYLSLIILFLSLNNLQTWLVEKDLIHLNYYIDYLHVSWNIFLGPMFYLFLVNYLRIKKQLKNIFLITILVFILSIVLRLFFLGYIKSKFETAQFYVFLRKYNTYEDMFVFLYTIPIFLFSTHIFFKQKRKFKIILSYDNLKWIRTFFLLSSIVLFFWLVVICLNYNFTNIDANYFYAPLHFGTSFLIYWLGFQGFNQNRLMQSRILLRKKINENEAIKICKKKVLKTEDLNDFKKIEKELIKQNLFLDPYLSLDSLAKKINTNTNNLSKLINNYSTYNFTDYINNFRVSYAKKLLTNKEYSTYTIIAIGLESGFNSKSTFYSAFKKFTNTTPTQFRKAN